MLSLFSANRLNLSPVCLKLLGDRFVLKNCCYERKGYDQKYLLKCSVKRQRAQQA
jgi:hypothetical protein